MAEDDDEIEGEDEGRTTGAGGATGSERGGSTTGAGGATGRDAEAKRAEVAGEAEGAGDDGPTRAG